jgi:pimeloyl-ACP methyl ester carboxylesterase
VLDSAGAGHAVLVGSSVGGATIIDYALAHPGRVTALVPVAAGLSGFPWQPTEVDAAIRAGDPELLAAAVRRTFLPQRTSPEANARIGQLLSDNLNGLAGLGTMWADFQPAYGRLTDIHVPTLAVVGDRDHDDFIRIAELLANEIPGARLVVLPGADHNVRSGLQRRSPTFSRGSWTGSSAHHLPPQAAPTRSARRTPAHPTRMEGLR